MLANLTKIVFPVKLLAFDGILLCDFLGNSLFHAIPVDKFLITFAVAGVDQGVVLLFFDCYFVAVAETNSALVVTFFFKILVIIRVKILIL